jgi:PKD repeat protein
MSASFNIRCNHNLVQSSFLLFPCQINLSSILIDYPAIKALISVPSDINVYDISGAAYVPVYIDLNLTYNKLLVYFQGAINNLADKTFRVTIGDVPSSNSYSVFSTYYERYWGLNAVDNTVTTDTCLASGAIMTKYTASFGHDAKFYKGGLGLTGLSTSPYIPCLVSANKFTFHLRFKKQDYSGGYAFFIRQSQNDTYATSIATSGNNLYIIITNNPLVKLAYIDTSGFSIGSWYDVFYVIDLTQPLHADKVKSYVDGLQVTVTFTSSWDGLTSTHSYQSIVHMLGEAITGANNPSIVDTIAVMPTCADEDFILTSANQYLNSNFWTIIFINIGNVSAFPSKTFVNHKVNFKSVFSSSSSFVWHFGDGTTSTKDTPWHTYTKAGIYTVILFVDDIECEDTCTIIVFESSFVMDAGAVYLNYGEKNQMLLGATEGGNLFGIDQDFRHMTFDTMKNSELAGSHRLTNSIPKIIANFIEINYRLLNIAMPGSDITFNSGSVTIKRAIRKLLNNDYVKNIAIVAEHGGTGCYIVFRILNAITVENIEIPFEDSNESVIEITFTGCFSESNYDDEPWQIDIITKD